MPAGREWRAKAAVWRAEASRTDDEQRKTHCTQKGIWKEYGPMNNDTLTLDTIAAPVGYVYILGPRGLDLPICKIGKTKNDPLTRCAQINDSSTGDILWDVKHAVMVDDYSALESLIHRELDASRQPGREFFNLTAGAAWQDHVRAIMERRQLEINEVMLAPPKPKSAKKTGGGQRLGFGVKKGDEAYAPILVEAAKQLEVKAPRSWGQFASEAFGYSDGVEGVQWNWGANRVADEANIGVNLEGMAYGGAWPITTFILSEIACPTLDALKASVSRPDFVVVSVARDAWQMASRPKIVEHYIGGNRRNLAEIDDETWRALMLDARDCLDKDKGFRGRSGQLVTRITKSQTRTEMMEVSPHLNISTRIDLGMDIE